MLYLHNMASSYSESFCPCRPCTGHTGLINIYVVLWWKFVLRQAFKDALALRRQQLQDVLELQNFRRDANELEKWIGEKMAIVNDENWKDLTNLEVLILLENLWLGNDESPKFAYWIYLFCENWRWFSCVNIICAIVHVLQNRLQKHAALEAEINANAGALKKLDDAGQEMVEKDHFGKDSVTVSVSFRNFFLLSKCFGVKLF